MSKANFFVDPDFPVIDGVGHADKQSYVNVKGGGCTNTTMFDSFVPGQHRFTCWLDRRAISPVSNVGGDPSYVNNAVDPSDAEGGVSNPGCLNAVPIGDFRFSRCSDKILLDRVIVNGSVSRAGGLWTDLDGPTTVGTPYPHPDPKCWIALVLDTAPSGLVFNPDLVFDNAQAQTAIVGGDSVPWLDQNWLHRFRVLAHEVLDFVEPRPWAVNLVDQFLFDGVTWERTISNTNYVYPFSTKGFRFDVDLNSALCSFSSSTGTYTDMVDCSLHVVACWFNGYDDTSHVLLGFENLGIEYQSVLFFRDFLSPQTFAPAGADGGVVADEAPDLDVLADQSAALAGLPALPDSPIRRPKKKTKASEGFYNFRPKAGGGDLFPDDPEIAVLPDASDGSALPSRRWKGARLGEYEHQGSYYGERKRWSPRNRRPTKRGKY